MLGHSPLSSTPLSSLPASVGGSSALNADVTEVVGAGDGALSQVDAAALLAESGTGTDAQLGGLIKPSAAVESANLGLFLILDAGVSVDAAGVFTGSATSVRALAAPPSVSWYAEVTVGAAGVEIGELTANDPHTNTLRYTTYGGCYKASDGRIYNAGVADSTNATYTTGDVIGVHHNVATGKVDFYKNNVKITWSMNQYGYLALSGALDGTLVNLGQAAFVHPIPAGAVPYIASLYDSGAITSQLNLQDEPGTISEVATSERVYPVDEPAPITDVTNGGFSYVDIFAEPTTAGDLTTSALQAYAEASNVVGVMELLDHNAAGIGRDTDSWGVLNRASSDSFGYCELTIFGTATMFSVGVISSANVARVVGDFNTWTPMMGLYATELGVSNAGDVRINNTVVATGAPFADGSIVGIITNGTSVSILVDGVAKYSGTLAGQLRPAAQVQNPINSARVHFNFGAEPFVYPPLGNEAYDRFVTTGAISAATDPAPLMVAEVGVLAETSTGIQFTNRSASETLTASEVAGRGALKTGAEASVAEALADQVTGYDYADSQADTAAISEASGGIVSKEVSGADSATPTDSESGVIFPGGVVVDAALGIDTIHAQADMYPSVHEALAAAESYGCSFAYATTQLDAGSPSVLLLADSHFGAHYGLVVEVTDSIEYSTYGVSWVVAAIEQALGVEVYHAEAQTLDGREVLVLHADSTVPVYVYRATAIPVYLAPEAATPVYVGSQPTAVYVAANKVV